VNGLPHAWKCACSCGLHLPLDDHRERESKRRALAGLRLDPNPTTVHFDDALGYGEAQSSTAFLAGDGIVGLLKLLEQLGLIGCRDTGFSITDRYMKRPVVRFSLDGNFADISELNRIADEIDEDLRQAATVATAWWQFGGHLDLEGEFFVGRQRLKRAADGLGNVLDAVIGSSTS
jgi:hypothetical protein